MAVAAEPPEDPWLLQQDAAKVVAHGQDGDSDNGSSDATEFLARRFQLLLQERDDELFRRLDELFQRQACQHGAAAGDAMPDSDFRRSISDGSNAVQDELLLDKIASRRELKKSETVERMVEEMRNSVGRISVSGDLPFHSEDPGTRLQKFARRLVSSWHFEGFFTVVIITNAVLLGAQVNYAAQNADDSSTPFVFRVLQYLYAFVFLAELLMRMTAEGVKAYICTSINLMWNWLDVFIVLTSLLEIGFDIILATGNEAGLAGVSNMRILRIVKITRLLRILRIVRLVRFIRALRSLVTSIMGTMRALMWSMVLLVIIMYVFGILFTDGATAYRASFMRGEGRQDTADKLFLYFGDLHDAMHTLFRCISEGMSWIDVVKPLIDVSWFWGYLFTAYIVFAVFAVLNVMTGVFCQSAIDSASRDREMMAQTVIANKERNQKLVAQLFQKLHCSQSGKVTLEAFEQHFHDPDVKAFFHGLDLEPNDAWMLFTLLDEDGSGDVDAEEFVEGCMKLKGPARSIDLAALWRDCKKANKKVSSVEARSERLEYHMSALRGEMQKVQEISQAQCRLGEKLLKQTIEESPENADRLSL